MGTFLSAEGLDKIKAIQEMPHRTDAKAVQWFIGFVTSLAKFMPRLSVVCEPLRRLLDRDMTWHWPGQAHQTQNRHSVHMPHSLQPAEGTRGH